MIKYKLKKYKWQILIVFLLIFGIFIFPIIKNAFKKDNEIILYGNIEIRQVNLGFRVAGRIKEMFFEEGDSVEKGTLLALLDDEPYKDVLNQAKAGVVAKKVAYENAAITYERNFPLSLDTTISAQQGDDFLTAKKQTKADYNLAVAKLASAKTDLRDTKIYAPCKGTILTRIQEPGAIVSPTQNIYSVAKMDPLWVRVYIPEPYLGQITTGMKAKVYTDSYPEKPYQGVVGYISPVAEFTPKEVETVTLRTDLVYLVRVYIYDIDKHLLQGMPVTVKINLANSQSQKEAR